MTYTNGVVSIKDDITLSVILETMFGMARRNVEPERIELTQAQYDQVKKIGAGLMDYPLYNPFGRSSLFGLPVYIVEKQHEDARPTP